MTLRIGSVCSGYEGLGLAVQAVLGGEIAWLADNDEGASKVLAYRYPLVPNLGDITVTDWAAVEPVDVLTAGFPCQDISCAGKRAGLREGNRSGVWSHVVRAIAALRPPLVVIENVKELLSERADSDVEPCPWCMGDTSAESAMRALGAVLADLAEIGFDAEWVSVPAASAGACHLRWRVFVLAWPAANAGSGELQRRRVAGILGSAPPAEPGEGDQRERAGNPAGDSGSAALADSAGTRQARREDPQADSGDAGPRELRSAEPQRGSGERAPADPESISQREPADEADAIPGSRGPRAVPGGGSTRVAADAERNELARESQARRRSGDGTAAAGSGSGPLADAERGGRDGRAQEPQRGPEWGTAAAWHRPGAFGRYEAAVRRHERVFGRLVPAPVEPARNGSPRLSPAFTEWMMGLPEGWVTDVPGLSRNAQLKALGNGVVPAQAAMALRLLLDRADIPSLVAAKGDAA